jgi:predicted 2-oxoglutarate/Fe(II)-dependent dioxygenase YbiX
MLALLRRFGVFIEPGFLDVSTCRAICAEMSSADGEPGFIHDGVRATVDVGKKRLIRTELAAERGAFVDQRLADMTPSLNRHFDITLTGSEGAMFYRYGVGDFFAVHRDRYPNETAFDHQRRVSIVILLNDPAGRAGVRYDGGALVVYDLMGAGPEADYGISVPPEAGLLVAFRSELRHEVTAVTSGTRCVAVSRFF